MNVKNIWKSVKSRYRLSTKVQMNFELSFPLYLIGKCCITTHNVCEIKTQKISPSLKGIVFSDTIPLSWFTSSVLIPWDKVLKIAVSDIPPSIEGFIDTSWSQTNTKVADSLYCTIGLDDPRDMIIDLPWSQECTDYVQKNSLIEI